METINCDLHKNSILIFEPNEEYMYSDKIEGTIVFCDSRNKKYLKKYTIGQCDEICTTVQTILEE